MSDKKNLKIEAMVCDLREINEEILKQYADVSIEAMILYTSEKSQEILNKYHVHLEAMITEKLANDVETTECNGIFTLKPGPSGIRKTCLLVNGKLILEPGCQDVLLDYVKIIVNGEAIYPESLGPYLISKLTCNGRGIAYPDHALYMDGPLLADRVFILRAKENAQYYTPGKAVFLDPQADYQKLAQKQASITANSALAAESSLETVLGLLNEDCSVTVLPDNCIYLNSSLSFDSSFPLQYGTAVYVDGDLEITDADALKGMDFLQVTGEVTLKEEDKPAFLAVCKKFGRLATSKGRLIQDLQDFLVDKSILEASPEGLNISDCVTVTISEDIPPALILERLTMSDCVNIICPQPLMSAVKLIASDYINLDLPDDGSGPKEDNSVHIESMVYRM